MAAPRPLQELTFYSVVGAPRPVASTGAEADNGATPKRGYWLLGLCECLARPLSCISVACCEPCTVGQITSISRGGSAKWCLATALTLLVLGVVGFGLGYSSDNTVMTLGTILSVIAMVLAFIAVCVARGRVREQNGIEGSAFGDCCLSFWCGPCRCVCAPTQALLPTKQPAPTHTHAGVSFLPVSAR